MQLIKPSVKWRPFCQGDQLIVFPMTVMMKAPSAWLFFFIVIEIVALGPVSISGKTSYCKISQSLEAARFVFRIVRSL